MKDDFEIIYNQMLEKINDDYIKLNNLLYKKPMLLIGNILLIMFIIATKSVIPFYYYLLIALVSLLIIQIVIAIIFNKKMMKRYQYLYEENIIKPLINVKNRELLIEDDKKIEKEIYDNAEFEKYYNLIIGNKINKYLYFKSNTGIYGKEYERNIIISGIKIGYDIDENTFEGIFCCVTLNNSFYKDSIRIRNIKDKKQTIAHKKEQIELDSNQLINTFNIFTKDKKKANEILNSINNERIINLCNKYNNLFEVTLKDNKLYIRILSIFHFEGFPAKNPLEKKEIEKVYNIINFIFELIDLFIEIADKK